MKKLLLVLVFFFMFSVGVVNADDEQNVTVSEYLYNIVKDADATSIEVILDTGLAYDGTVDNNLRYVGSNPNNYVLFNGELWRIVGVMNNVDDGNGNIGTMVKIIRNEPLGKYSWDSSLETANLGYGINEWSQADIMKELNGDYLNIELVENPNWFNYAFEEYYDIFDKTKALSSNAQSLITDVVWYTGSNGSNNIGGETTGLVSNYYSYEHGDLTGKVCTSVVDKCSDTVERTVRWNGKVALLSVSDYGYATSGGFVSSRDVCLTKPLFYWSTEGYSDCYLNNWLYDSEGDQWLITPKGGGNDGRNVFKIMSNGRLSSDAAFLARSVYPTVFLKSSVVIAGGKGTIDEPYLISEVYKIVNESKDENGSISFDTDNATVADQIAVNITPNKGYVIDKVYVNGVDVTELVKDNKLILDSIMMEQNVDVTFKPAPVDNPNTLDLVLLYFVIFAVMVFIAFIFAKLNIKKYNI